MENNVFVPADFCNKSIGFKVPIYQRLFVWGEEQITGLLKDLSDASECQSTKHYYIGIITVVKRHDSKGREVWELVDGQQRMTFLMLLGAMVKKCQGNGASPRWADFATETRMRYVGRPEDEKDLKSLISPDPSSMIKNPNMRRFVECFETFANGRTLSDFSEYVLNHAAFLVSELSANLTNFELNQYFERLNATGRQLEPEEIVKATYFSEYAGQWNRLIDFSNEYEEGKEAKGSSGLEAAGTDEQNKQPRTIEWILRNEQLQKDEDCEPVGSSPNIGNEVVQSIVSLPVFLLHVLRLTCSQFGITGDAVSRNPHQLIETFQKSTQKLREKNPNWAGEFVKVMEQYRLWMDKNIIFRVGDEYGFRDKNNLKITEDVDPSDGAGQAACRQFQAMLYVSSEETQEWVCSAYHHEIAGKGNDTSNKTNDKWADLLKTLKAQDSERYLLPSAVDEAMTYPSIDRYWFWKLDYLLWEKCLLTKFKFLNGLTEELPNAESSCIKSFHFRAARSKEHLHPQHPENPETELPNWQKDRKEHKDKQRNGFGNLALISSSFNSEQGNAGIGVKFARVQDRLAHGQLESIKMLLMFKLAEGQERNWTPELAKKHGDAMYQLLKEGSAEGQEHVCP